MSREGVQPPGRGRLRVGVVGATGYGGTELVRLLLGHPKVQLMYVASRSAETPLDVTYPNLGASSVPDLQVFDPLVCAQSCDFAFVALPSGVSGEVAVDLWQRGVRTVDLSGDLRLPASVYRAWYAKVPVDEQAQRAAVYGMTEWASAELATASLVANPGCYATAVGLALKPLAARGWLEGTVMVDAKSGVSGAGRGANPVNLLGDLSDNMYAYKLGKHQHTPEIEQFLGGEVRVLMTAQVIPAVRGIYACMYVPWGRGHAAMGEIQALYEDTYRGTSFVKVLPSGQVPSMKSTRGANSCFIGVHWDERTEILQIVSTIDNLQKGAAGQAVQNMNVMNGWAEADGLTVVGMYP